MTRLISRTRGQLNIAISLTNQVLYAGWGPPPPGLVKEEHMLLAGPVAEELYVALTGHDFGEGPDAADETRAWDARLYLAALGGDEAETAARAAQKQGWIIRPWLGIVALDERRQPVMDAAFYRSVAIA